MKKTTKAIILLIVVILLFPVPSGVYKDGGTRAYTSLTYKIVKWNRLTESGETYEKLRFYPIPFNFFSIGSLWEREPKDGPAKGIYYTAYDADYTRINYSEENFEKMVQQSENSDQFTGFTKEKLPIIRIDSPLRLSKMLASIGCDKDLFSDKDYDDEFFEDKTLFAIYADEGSGSIRHKLTGLNIEDGIMSVEITPQIPEAGTADMAAWLITFEVKNDIVADCTQFYASYLIEYGTDISVSSSANTSSDTSSVVVQNTDESSSQTYLYCGNTMTSIKPYKDKDSEGVSFDGDDSVTLTDMLRKLDYSGGICKCLPQYLIKTEIGSYGVNLSEGYARTEQGQARLSDEQVKIIREIINRRSS